MTALRILLLAMLIALGAYTTVTIANQGWNLLPVFFGDLAAMEWSGQFNADFMSFLLLSALWTAWRNHFSTQGLVLAPVAFFGGMVFLASYLLLLSFRTKSISELLLGTTRAAAAR